MPQKNVFHPVLNYFVRGYRIVLILLGISFRKVVEIEGNKIEYFEGNGVIQTSPN